MENKNLQKWNLKHIVWIMLISFLSALTANLLIEIDIEFNKYFDFFSNFNWIYRDKWYYVWIIPLILIIILCIKFHNMLNQISEINSSKKVKYIINLIFEISLSIFSAWLALSFWQLFFYDEKCDWPFWQFNSFFSGIFTSFISLLVFLIILIIFLKLFYNKNK